MQTTTQPTFDDEAQAIKEFLIDQIENHVLFLSAYWPEDGLLSHLRSRNLYGMDTPSLSDLEDEVNKHLIALLNTQDSACEEP